MVFGVRRLFAAFFLSLIMLSAGGGIDKTVIAKEKALVVDLSDDLIAITTGFTGKRVVLFGVVDNADGKADIAVVVRGPTHSPIIRRKEQVAGIWLNRHELTFVDVPSFYASASNRPLEDIASASVLDKYGIGTDHLEFVTMGDDPSLPENEFRAAMFRLKKAKGLYQTKPGEVTLMPKGLFRAGFVFPSNVPTGMYNVEVYFFRDGKLVDYSMTPLAINKVGFSAQVYEFAMLEPFAYAILSLLMALLTGWLASAMFNRSK